MLCACESQHQVALAASGEICIGPRVCGRMRQASLFGSVHVLHMACAFCGFGSIPVTLLRSPCVCLRLGGHARRPHHRVYTCFACVTRNDLWRLAVESRPSGQRTALAVERSRPAVDGGARIVENRPTRCVSVATESSSRPVWSAAGAASGVCGALHVIPHHSGTAALFHSPGAARRPSSSKRR